MLQMPPAWWQASPTSSMRDSGAPGATEVPYARGVRIGHGESNAHENKMAMVVGLPWV
jgi:hypothetical protein